MIHSSSTVTLFLSLQFCVGVYSLFITSVDSGHGGQVKDETGKECDGMDEGTQRNVPYFRNCLISPLIVFFCHNFQLSFRSIFKQLVISLITFVATLTILIP